jgi:hypothetical protein
MDARVRQFIAEHAKNLVGLDMALFFQANPRTFDTAEGLACRTYRDVEQIRAALDRLAEAGILEIFSRGEGRYTCYALVKNRTVWDLLCLLSEAYVDDLETRKEIVRLLIRAHLEDRRATEQADSST